MKTILSRCKTLVRNNNGTGQTLSYVRDVEVVHPDLSITLISKASLPKILFTPVSTVERWVASGRKEALNVINAYLVLQYMQRESSIMGDETRPGGQGKGIIDFVGDFLSVFRGQRFTTGGSPYLDKPMDVTNIDYADPISIEDGYLLVAALTLECSRLFDQAALPGNI